MCVCRVADGIACRRFFFGIIQSETEVAVSTVEFFLFLFVRCSDHDMLRGFSFEVEVLPV